MNRIKRAIVSVFDKSNLSELVRFLLSREVEVYSTGGTLRYLQDQDLAVRSVQELTNFPEIMGGRVKTLHPGVLAGILCDQNNPQHLQDLKQVEIEPVDLVIVNLYPFQKTLEEGKGHEELIEMIDIGGPTMLRAAAKNYQSVIVLCDPEQYGDFMEHWENDDLTQEYRLQLARETFQHVTAYDMAIARYFDTLFSPELPERLYLAYQRESILRYGENPHQKGAFYLPLNRKKAFFQQLHGKKLSFNNYGDIFSAWEMVKGWGSVNAVVIIKHSNPCGFAIGNDALEAYRRAVSTDPVSYFGGIVASNRIVNKELAEELRKSFLECIIAPGFSPQALEILQKKKNLRLMIPEESVCDYDFVLHSIGSGLLYQIPDVQMELPSEWKLVTTVGGDERIKKALYLGWYVVKYVKSNAIVISSDEQTLGIGAGQMSRVDSLKIAVRKAKEAGLNLKGAVLASDAFFPFRDSVDLAAEEGIVGIVQPGGSVRDQEVIQAANEYGICMYFTGVRHFRHY